MKIVVINGSPREHWNTATLLEQAAQGARSQGAEVEIIHLYRLKYQGCISCFACKRRGGKSLHSCVLRDDLTPVFEKIKEADGVIFGSPIYFNDITGAMRSFFERLLFQHLPYEAGVDEGSYFPKKLPTAFVFTMGAPDGDYKDEVLAVLAHNIENFASMIFRVPMKTLYSNNAYQFDDYAQYEASAFDVADKIRQRDEIFPVDCQRAFALGAELAAR